MSVKVLVLNNLILATGYPGTATGNEQIVVVDSLPNDPDPFLSYEYDAASNLIVKRALALTYSSYDKMCSSDPATWNSIITLDAATIAYNLAMEEGCPIVSTSTPAFNDNYAIADASTKISMLSILQNFTLTAGESGGPFFPNGLTTQTWWDVTGTKIHIIPSPAFFIAFSRAIGLYYEELTMALMNVQQGITADWVPPVQPVVIP